MRRWSGLGSLVLAAHTCVAAAQVAPPVPKAVPHRLELHGQVRTDEYYWLKERENPEVLSYLKAENDYTAAMMAHTAPLQEQLFQEFKTRIKQTDVSVPFRKDGYYYYSRTEDGKNYGIACRKKGSLEVPEEVILDVNEVCAGHKFCSVSGQNVSSDGRLLGYGIDSVGRRFYTLRFKDLTTGKHLADEIPNVTANLAWASDGKTVFYTRQDPETLRAYQVYRHVLGTDSAKDTLVYEERDETFGCYVYLTKSKRYVMIVADQTLSTEVRYLEADRPGGELRLFLARERDHEYGVDHYGDSFYIRTNKGAKNFRLMKTPVKDTDAKRWTEVIPHRDDVFLEDFEIFRDHLVVSERKEGLLQLRVRPWSGAGEHYVEFGEPAYVAFPQANFEFDTPVLRYGYASMTTPSSVYDYDMRTREKTLLKRDEVLGGFDTKNYRTERMMVQARDGKRVPLSLVYRLPFTPDGSRPLLLYGYGSYGSSMDAGFDPFRISLLDRGFVFAIAHVRGGQELGRDWYEDGKLLHKKNTFTDFIDCADHLVKAKYADSKRVFAWGGSAGGLLVGAVVTMRPELWAGAIAEVPFVDVVTTMLDDDIPLTTGEFDEWGDPKNKEYYDYMLSYSPYDQTRPAAYPSLLVTTGLHDSQVQYWEPAKWVARLRAVKQNAAPVLLKTEMEAGHGGLTARDDRYRERAFRLAFLLDVAGLGG